MNSKLLIVFLFLALLALVVDAQKNDNSQNDDSQKNKNDDDETNVIDQCIKKYNCAPDNRKCRAACAGVPSGDKKVAMDTQACYTKCHDDHPTDVPAYTTCTNNCKKNVYQEGVTEPGSAVPKADSQSDGQTTSTDGGDESDNKTDTNDNTTQSDNNGNEKKDSGASLVSKSVLVYVFAAVLACAAFTAGL